MRLPRANSTSSRTIWAISAAQHVAGEFGGRRFAEQPSAGEIVFIEYRAGMAGLAEIIRRREARRAGPDNRHPLARRRPAFGPPRAPRRRPRHSRADGLSASSRPIDRRPRSRFKSAYRHGGVEIAAAADFFARGGTNPPQNGGQGDVALHRGDRPAHIARSESAAAFAGMSISAGQAQPRGRRDAIAQVIAQEEFERLPPGGLRCRFACSTFIPCRRVPGAGGASRPSAVDLHQTAEARSGGCAAFEEAEGGNVDAQLARGVEHRRSRRDFHFAVVDGEFHRTGWTVGFHFCETASGLIR